MIHLEVSVNKARSIQRGLNSHLDRFSTNICEDPPLGFWKRPSKEMKAGKRYNRVS